MKGYINGRIILYICYTQEEMGWLQAVLSRRGNINSTEFSLEDPFMENKQIILKSAQKVQGCES